MLIPDPRRTPLPNLISHNGIILYQWEFLRARLDEGEGLPWIAMDSHMKLGKLKVKVLKGQNNSPDSSVSSTHQIKITHENQNQQPNSQ